MRMLRLVYSDDYYLPLGEHVFPAAKYRFVQRRLLETGVAQPEDFVKPIPATDDDVLLVHTPEYVDKLKTGRLSIKEALRLEVPYSRALVEAFWLSAGGSILAARLAFENGVAISIGGGFHHAFPDHGEGFCMINDVAIAIRRMQKVGKVRRVMTVDCDVHQGNGTAAIFQPAANGAIDVFTISLHQEHNYPAWKPSSSIDVNLPDRLGDAPYLESLAAALEKGLGLFEPDLICYLAGADPYREDQLGGLALTIEGLKQRDTMVFGAALDRGIPVMVTLAGGYATDLEDTVTIHCNTVIAAKETLFQ